MKAKTKPFGPFPIRHGHAYSLRGVPWAIWKRATTRAKGEQSSIRSVLIRLLDYYTGHGVPMPAAKPEPPQVNP